jgi:hypothetical protein
VKTPSVYGIPCERGKIYIGQTGCLIQTRVKEHHRHIPVYLPEKAAVAERGINLGHRIQLRNTIILSKKTRQVDWNLRAVVEVEHYFNREDGFSLSWAWKPLFMT